MVQLSRQSVHWLVSNSLSSTQKYLVDTFFTHLGHQMLWDLAAPSSYYMGDGYERCSRTERLEVVSQLLSVQVSGVIAASF